MAVEGQAPTKIEERFNPETPMVLVDSEQLKHALTNVLENSLYFVAGLPATILITG